MTTTIFEQRYFVVVNVERATSMNTKTEMFAFQTETSAIDYLASLHTHTKTEAEFVRAFKVNERGSVTFLQPVFTKRGLALRVEENAIDGGKMG